MEMKRVLAWIQGVALSLGGPGLFLVAFLDSSFLSFPEIVDLLVIWMTTHHRALMVYYATLATLGSIAGCFALYFVARKGGEAFLRKRFHERHVDRALDAFRRHGLLAVIVPSLLPPPAPFKIFVLAAGVAEVRPLQFGIAIALGRGARYFGEGLLAIWYGEWAMTFMRENAKPISLALAIAILVLGIGWAVWQRRRGSGVDLPTSSPE